MRMQLRGFVAGHAVAIRCAAAAAVASTIFGPVAAQTVDRTRDRGTGIPLSSFGTYITPGEFILYPFAEYYRDRNAEYSPEELGFGLDQDFRAAYRAVEGLIFIAYGISDRLAFEFEAAVIRARQDKAPDDPTAMPDRLEQSGLGDVEGQLRWRWNDETDARPEFFSYFETVLPIQKKKKLIGTPDWELKLGFGMVRGHAWGTTTLRAGIAWDEGALALGEYAVEYLRRVSSRLRVYAGIEGSEDEIEAIAETQWFLSRDIILKLNNAFGVTSKATGWAPEVGLMIHFR